MNWIKKLSNKKNEKFRYYWDNFIFFELVRECLTILAFIVLMSKNRNIFSNTVKMGYCAHLLALKALIVVVGWTATRKIIRAELSWAIAVASFFSIHASNFDLKLFNVFTLTTSSGNPFHTFATLFVKKLS